MSIDFEKMWEKLQKLASLIREKDGWSCDLSRIEDDEKNGIFLNIYQKKEQKLKGDYFA